LAPLGALVSGEATTKTVQACDALERSRAGSASVKNELPSKETAPCPLIAAAAAWGQLEQLASAWAPDWSVHWWALMT
jgi:hypothetical protein